MKKITIFILLLFGLIGFWKCPFKYKNSNEIGYYVLNCAFYPDRADKKECIKYAKQQKCKPYKY